MIRRTNNPKIQQRMGYSFLRSIQGTVAVGFLALVFSACADNQRAVVAPVSPTPTSPTPASPTISPTPASPTPASPTASPVPITRPLTELVGQTVTVSTKVQRVINPNLFTVYDTESLRGQTVLVATTNQAPPANTNIEMTGVIRNFVATDVQKEYGNNITSEVQQEFANKPYIAAIAIERVN